MLGVSLGLTVHAVAPDPPPWNGDVYLTDLAAAALSYVAGFVVLVAPGGLGVRELILESALRPRFVPAEGETLAAALATVIALVLRLTWTAAEVVAAVALYAWRPATEPTTAPGEVPDV